MNGSLQVLPQDMDRCVSDGFSGLHQGATWNDNGEHRHQFATSPDAVVDADTSASCILNLSNFANEKFRHAKRVESVAASHSHSPSLCNDGDHFTSVRYPTELFVTNRNNRFRDATCSTSVHSTNYTNAHSVVAGYIGILGRMVERSNKGRA